MLFFYTLIFIQLFSILGAFADKVKKDSSDINSIQWEKVNGNQTKHLKQIIWKSYKDNEDYFKNKNDKSSEIKKFNYFKEDNKYKFQIKPDYSITQIEPYLPLNNFLNYGDFQTSVRWKSSFDGGASLGTGQQNPSFIFDYGVSDSNLLSVYFSEADDNLYNLIDGQESNYHWQNFAISFKKKLLAENPNIFGLSMVSTVEYFNHASGSENTKSIYNQKDNAHGRDKFDSIVGAFSLPFSKSLNENFTFFIVPGVSFLPEKLGSKGIGKNSYGNNFYLGSGFVLDLAENVDLLASYTTPLGPGNNYFNSDLKFSRKSLYSLGLGWDINHMIGIEGKITNSFGSSPSTGLLTIPSDNKPLYSANFIYRPYGEDTFLAPLDDRDNLINHGGIFVSNALMPEAGTSQASLNYDSKGNQFGFYGYSLSNIFQLELLNIGKFKEINSNNSSLQSTYLNPNNANYRFGGKLLIFSPQKNDLFWMSFRTSVGRNDDTNQGYLFSELINTYRLNNRIAFNLSPKYLFSGVESFAGIGVSSYINLFDNLQLIPEINSTLKNNSDLNSSIALRYSFDPGQSIDLYYSNAAGIQDIGTLIEDKEYRFGIKLNISY